MASSQNFQAISAMYEQNAENTTYTVYEITQDARVMTSNFQSKTRAFEYAREFTDETSRVYVYKTKCIKVFDPSGEGAPSPDHIFNQNVDLLLQAANMDDEEDTDPEYVPSDEEDDCDYADMPELESYHDLSGLNFTEYGKGYLLSPGRKTRFSGEKYLMGGWWNSSLNGWVFRRSSFDELIADPITPRECSNPKPLTIIVFMSVCNGKTFKVISLKAKRVPKEPVTSLDKS